MKDENRKYCMKDKHYYVETYIDGTIRLKKRVFIYCKNCGDVKEIK